ncbi:hypothetical protein CK203_116525 [Vitis vinifera]|uniref:Retrotransposon gag domain-containing protein n=1 Tax=Vitis vinifera TaxID=29760 RepID=A0A438EPD7_VITVI|nr:hypothetical protein CK203_116525 [Vitis vinifera]
MVPGCEIGKLEHLTGATKKPPEDDPTFQNWDLEDSIVIAWLINSMELKIGQMYLFLPTAKESVGCGKENLSQTSKTQPRVFEIRCKLKETKQGNHCVTQYYTDLQALRQELNLFIEADYCPECTEKQRRSIVKERMFDFLASLNKDLDEV